MLDKLIILNSSYQIPGVVSCSQNHHRDVVQVLDFCHFHAENLHRQFADSFSVIWNDDQKGDPIQQHMEWKQHHDDVGVDAKSDTEDWTKIEETHRNKPSYYRYEGLKILTSSIRWLKFDRVTDDVAL